MAASELLETQVGKSRTKQTDWEKKTEAALARQPQQSFLARSNLRNQKQTLKSKFRALSPTSAAIEKAKKEKEAQDNFGANLLK